MAAWHVSAFGVALYSHASSHDLKGFLGVWRRQATSCSQLGRFKEQLFGSLRASQGSTRTCEMTFPTLQKKMCSEQCPVAPPSPWRGSGPGRSSAGSPRRCPVLLPALAASGAAAEVTKEELVSLQDLSPQRGTRDTVNRLRGEPVSLGWGSLLEPGHVRDLAALPRVRKCHDREAVGEAHLAAWQLRLQLLLCQQGRAAVLGPHPLGFLAPGHGAALGQELPEEVGADEPHLGIAAVRQQAVLVPKAVDGYLRSLCRRGELAKLGVLKVRECVT